MHNLPALKRQQLVQLYTEVLELDWLCYIRSGGGQSKGRIEDVVGGERRKVSQKKKKKKRCL